MNTYVIDSRIRRISNWFKPSRSFLFTMAGEKLTYVTSYRKTEHSIIQPFIPRSTGETGRLQAMPQVDRRDNAQIIHDYVV